MPARIAIALAIAGPAHAQEVVELPVEDRLLNADIPEVYRVGGGGSAWELLTTVTSLSFDARGNLHIADLSGGELEVIVVDPRGTLVRRFGRKGEGPGEFRDATEAFALADGRTVVPDNGHFAYHVFAPGGSFDRMVRYPGVGPSHNRTPAETPARNPRLRMADPWSGDLILRVTRVWEVQIDSVTRIGSIRDVDGPRQVLRLHLGEEDSREDTVSAVMSSDGGAGFQAEFLFGPLPDGAVAISNSQDYAIRIAGPSPEVTRVLVRRLAPRPWTDRRLEEYTRHLQRGFREAAASGGGVAGIVGGIDNLISSIGEARFSGDIPLIETLETTWEGNIWVGRVPADGFPDLDFETMLSGTFAPSQDRPRPRRPGPIDILTPGGAYIGTLPSATMPVAFGPDGLAAYLEINELDVPEVVVRRLPEGVK